MFEKVLEGTEAEAMLIAIPVLTIVITLMVRVGMCVANKVKQVSQSRRESEDILLHDDDGHEHHITVEEALDEVMIESERTRHYTMKGMLGLDPNRLELDYEKNFPEHDLPPIEEDIIPPGVNRQPRPSQSSLMLKWSQESFKRKAEMQKSRLGKRHSIAVTTNDCSHHQHKSEEIVDGVGRKKSLAKITESVPLASRPQFKRQRSISCSPCSPEDLADLAKVRGSRKLSKNRR